MQVVNAGGNHDALGVGPRTIADAVARIHRASALRSQVSVSCLSVGTDHFCSAQQQA